MPLEDIWALVTSHAKLDRTYVPLKDTGSRRWHVTSLCGEFEILTTGAKWYDTRARRGGGGTIDLTMHLLGVPFVEAVNYLIDAANRHGRDRP
jgi:hypothetical protein